MEKKMKKENNILHLFLKTKWFDLISSGEKDEEYRIIKTSWVKQLCFFPEHLKRNSMTGFEVVNSGSYNVRFEILAHFKGEDRPVNLMLRNYRKVVFHKGYTSNTIEFFVENIRIGNDGKLDWGAPAFFKPYFIIKLGRRIK